MKKVLLTLAFLSCMSVSVASDKNGFAKETYSVYFSSVGIISGTLVGLKAIRSLAQKSFIKEFPALTVPMLLGGYLGYHLGYDVGSVVEHAKKITKAF